MTKKCLVILVLVLNAGVLHAQEIPKLSGIMQGEQPAAILNDKIVAVGEIVDGFRIVEVGNDYVVCEGRRGVIRLSMAEPESKKEQSKIQKVTAPAVSSSPVAPSVSGTTQQMQAKARKYLERSVDYLKEADALLKSPFVFERLYAKAIALCESADREAQAALRSVTEDVQKKGIGSHIEKIRKAKADIVKEKADYNMRIRTLVSARQVATGMTQSDAVSSWGQPLMRNRDGVLEKWVYQDANGYQKELVFKEGILVSF